MARVGHLFGGEDDSLRDILDTKVFSTSKHAGATWREVLKADPDYVKWFLSGNCDVPRSEELEDALTEHMEAIEMFPDWRREQRGR